MIERCPRAIGLPGRQRVVIAWCLLLCATPLVAQNPLPPLFGEGAAEQRLLDQIKVSRRQEKQIGQAQFANFRKSLRGRGVRLLVRGRDVEYIRRLVGVLHEQMSHRDRYPNFTVYLAKTKSTDARAFPGGIIIVTAGMLELAETEAALAGVLAHELSHIDRGHQLDRYRRLAVAQEGFQGGHFSLAEMFSRGRLLINTYARPFRPEQESEADADAARWALRSGYSPLEFAHLFDRFANRAGGRNAPRAAFWQSHPPHRQRLAAVAAVAATEARQRGVVLAELYVGRENLQRRIPRQEKIFP
ncbi:MAG: M48 family metallopeptidase [Planctomycetota bacterium]|nr:M48 family metallopeptidase [Planctomycetota bacterium]